jgi:hypothetical protein
MRTLSEVGSSLGAPMGRRNDMSDTAFPVSFEVERLRWVDGAYDQGGAYWGRSTDNDYIFRAEGASADAVESVFVRGRTLDEAKAAIVELYPNASFAPSTELEAFLSSYREAALWSSHNELHDEDPEEQPENLEDQETCAALDASMRSDCEDFLTAHAPLLAQAMTESGYDIEQAGHDFWLTRNHHGAGFWDRGLGKVGDELTEAAHAYGEVDLYLGEDGMVHDMCEPSVAEEQAQSAGPSL